MKLIGILVILVIFFILAANSGEENPSSPQSADQPTVTSNQNSDATTNARPYELGLGYVTANRSLGVDQGWEKVSEVAHVAYIQRSWQEWAKGEADADIKAALNKGLRLYLAFEPLVNDRNQVSLANGATGKFGDSNVQNSYLEQVKKITSTYKPAYFISNVEIDLYKPHNEADYREFVKFYPKVYNQIKEVSPNTMVAVSITYSDYDGQNGIDAKDKQTFKNLVADFDQHSDLLAVSTYPFSYLKPSNIPDSFFVDMMEASSKPLFIAETSWVSNNFVIPIPGNPLTFEGSEDLQAQFIDKMKQAAEYAKSQNKKVQVINFVSLIDISEFGCNIIKVTSPHFEWFCSLGITKPNGQPKKSFQTLKNWKNSLP